MDSQGSESVYGENEEDMDYASEICDVISRYVENPLELSTFATGGEIDMFNLGIPAVSIHNVGRIAYPLCFEQSATLLGISTQAPFGKGTETVVDIAVRRAWQIDSDLVVINKQWLTSSLPKIVTDCCAKLGVDAIKMNVRANLYKMLLYEEGGHFKTHRDTEKEPGMFGSLLIQLPAEHEGGALVVGHGGKSKRFDFSKDSGDKAFYSAFYADCEHMLEPVTKGLRLVLAFNLVRGSHSSDVSSAAASVAHRQGFEDVLSSAARAWNADEDSVQKFIYPLAFKYTQTNVSFAGLKGADLKVLNLLQGVADPHTNEKLFSVYIALVTKHVTGQDDEDDYGGDDDKTIEYQTDTWVGPHGAFDFGSLTVDLASEIITSQGEDEDEDEDEKYGHIFGDRPDREEKEGYQGNYPGTAEYWYSSAVLVFWPAARDFDIKLAASPQQAVAALHAIDRASPDFEEKLTKLLSFLRGNSVKWSVHSVLPLTRRISQVEAVLTMATKLPLDEMDCRVIAETTSKYGLVSLTTEFSALLYSQSLKTVVVLLGLVKEQCEEHPLVCTTSSTPQTVSWADLLQVLAAKLKSSPLVNVTDVDLVIVCNFITANCDLDTQEAVAKHLGKTLQLKSLNYIISHAQSFGPHEDFLEDQLKEYATLAVIKTPQSAVDVLAVVEWVVRDEHHELMTALKPKLTALCNSPELFRSLFALPIVVATLKTDSPLSLDLESLVQSRIAKVVNHTTPPPFSWCMIDVPNTSSDARVALFLASHEQQTILYGFNGIGHARNWVSKYFGYGSRLSCINAVEGGTGQNARVTLTKNRSHYDIVVKKCRENLEELNNLRRMIRVRDVSGVEGSSSSSSKVRTEGGGVTERGEEQHVEKKARVEIDVNSNIGGNHVHSTVGGGMHSGVVKSSTPSKLREVIEID